MKITFLTILGIFLLPFLASASGGLFRITSLTNGFIITANDDMIPIGITINKGFWENQILKHDGTITASVSSGARNHFSNN